MGGHFLNPPAFAVYGFEGRPRLVPRARWIGTTVLSVAAGNLLASGQGWPPPLQEPQAGRLVQDSSRLERGPWPGEGERPPPAACCQFLPLLPPPSPAPL